MKKGPSPAKGRRCDAALRETALRLASESHSTQAATRALNTDPKRICKWQEEAFNPAAATKGAAFDPATTFSGTSDATQTGGKHRN